MRIQTTPGTFVTAILAPTLSPLLNAGERYLAGDQHALRIVSESLPPAVAFVERCRRLFHSLRPALPWNADHDAGQSIEQEFAQQQNALERIGQYLQGGEVWMLQQGLGILRESSARLIEDFDDLGRLARTSARYSPFP